MAVTFWDEAPPDGPPTDVTVRFVGIRRDSAGVEADAPTLPDCFDRLVTAPRIPAGVGRFAVTARVSGIVSGSWDVSAARAESSAPPRVERITTTFAPTAHGPAVRLWSWPLLVAAGAVLGLLLQYALLSRAGVNAVATLGISLLGCVLGYVGAKVYALVLHREHPRRLLRTGACVQGFLLVAFGVLGVGSAIAGLGAGRVLDITTPGLFLGMAVGRIGCFFTGCCAGRPTASRWGLWSSDRTVAVKRLPVQLIEAAVAALLGVAGLWLILARGDSAGALFAGTVAAYTLARQGLFGLRSDSRTPVGRVGAVVACLVVLVVAVVVGWR